LKKKDFRPLSMYEDAELMMAVFTGEGLGTTKLLSENSSSEELVVETLVRLLTGINGSFFFFCIRVWKPGNLTFFLSFLPM
jgi:hypothetical protein